MATPMETDNQPRDQLPKQGTSATGYALPWVSHRNEPQYMSLFMNSDHRQRNF
jgi:hypothetical protein